MGIFRSFAGVLEVELTGADPERSLRALNEAGIRLRNVWKTGDLTCCFQISRRDYTKLRQLTDKLGDRSKIVRRLGVLWTMGRLKKRPVLLVGVIALLLVTLYLPTRIFFVQVEGNVMIPSQLIIERAGDCGIVFGASRRDVRSERMKNMLLSAIPELRWAGVNTKGCVAVISVREKKAGESETTVPFVSNIIADRDAVIVSCTAEKGNLLCKVGQAVNAGDLLVSGVTDCGISIRAERAVGEVYGQTNRAITAITPSEYVYRTAKREEQRKFGLVIGKKRINFYKDSGILGTTCDKMSTVKYLTLPGGFVLPVALVEERWTCYESEFRNSFDDEAEKILTDFADSYLSQQMLAGKVLSCVQKLNAGNGITALQGRYACLEMISREINEESIIGYGKNH